MFFFNYNRVSIYCKWKIIAACEIFIMLEEYLYAVRWLLNYNPCCWVLSYPLPPYPHLCITGEHYPFEDWRLGLGLSRVIPPPIVVCLSHGSWHLNFIMLIIIIILTNFMSSRRFFFRYESYEDWSWWYCFRLTQDFNSDWILRVRIVWLVYGFLPLLVTGKWDQPVFLWMVR